MTETSRTKPRVRVRWTATERAEWLALFERSGGTAAEFCRANELSPQTLSVWLRRRSVPSPSTDEALVELPRAIVSAAARTAITSSGVTMQLPGGVRMEIVAGTDPIWLGQVLQMLLVARA